MKLNIEINTIEYNKNFKPQYIPNTIAKPVAIDFTSSIYNICFETPADFTAAIKIDSSGRNNPANAKIFKKKTDCTHGSPKSEITKGSATATSIKLSDIEIYATPFIDLIIYFALS